jgi:predicted nucleic acid-binding protein
MIKSKNDRIVFDSYAFIALFRNEPGGPFVNELLLKISNGEATGYLTSINLGEVYYMMVRKNNLNDADAAIHDILHFPVEIYEPDIKFCLQSALLKAKYKFSYADAFAAALTIIKKATLLTGDKEFDALIGEKGFKVKYL